MLEGLRRFDIVFRHALRNALIPVVTVFGPLIAGLLTGTFVVDPLYGAIDPRIKIEK